MLTLFLLMSLTAAAADSVRTVSVFYAKGKYTTKFDTFAQGASAFARFDNASNATGWGKLDVNTTTTDLTSYYAAGLAEGVLTCHFVAAVALNNGDVALQKNEGLRNYTLETIKFTRQMAEQNDDDFWLVVKQILAQFDGLVEGYGRSECSAKQPLNSLDMWFMQMDGDLEDLTNKFSKDKKSTTTQRPQHCSSLVKWNDDYSDVYFGHATWDIYNNAAPRIFKTYTLPVKLNGSTIMHTTAFSGTGPWLSSVDDFYVVTGHGNFGITETSNTVLNTDLYKKVKPSSLLCWIRVIAANRLARNGKDWGQVFSMHHSGTYTNQWQIIDLNLFNPGQPALTKGLLTIVEEIPGLMHIGDETKYLQQHGHWPSFNVPYYNDIREANGNYNGSWSKAPRKKLFEKFQHTVKSIDTMKSIMRWNKYQTTPIISGGNPCAAIACRADLRSTGTHPQSDFGAIDAKVTSYGSLMKKENVSVGSTNSSSVTMKNTLKVYAANGPTHDDQPAFCWSTSPTNPVPSHHLHPDCFRYGFEIFVPTLLSPDL